MGKSKYKIGDRFGSRIIIEEAGKNKYGNRLVKVRCICGNSNILRDSTLNNTKLCVNCANRLNRKTLVDDVSKKINNKGNQMSLELKWKNLKHEKPIGTNSCLLLNSKNNNYSFEPYMRLTTETLNLYDFWIYSDDILKIIATPTDCNCFKCITFEKGNKMMIEFVKELANLDPLTAACFGCVKQAVLEEEILDKKNITICFGLSKRENFICELLKDSQNIWRPLLEKHLNIDVSKHTLQIKYDLQPVTEIKVESEDNKWRVANQLLKAFGGKITETEEKIESFLHYNPESQIEPLEKEVDLKQEWKYKFENIDYGVNDYHLFQAINKSRKLIHDGMDGGHANVKAAGEFKVKVSDVAHHVGMIGSVVTKKRNAWKKK